VSSSRLASATRLLRLCRVGRRGKHDGARSSGGLGGATGSVGGASRLLVDLWRARGRSVGRSVSNKHQSSRRGRRRQHNTVRVDRSSAPVRMFWKASSTFVASRALVSMNESAFFSAYSLAASVGTSLKWRRSLLLPTSMMTMLGAAFSRNSVNHRSTF